MTPVVAASDALSRVVEGLQAGVTPTALLMIVIGVTIGIIVGAAPGIGATLGMIVLLPFALEFTPEEGVFLLCSVLVGGAFGGSLPAVLVGVPGSNSAMLTMVEGYPLARRGEGGRALMVSLVSSTLGQFVSIFIFIIGVIPLAEVGLKFLFPEMFAIVLVGLLTAAAFVNRQIVKGLVAVALGLLLATVGPDPVTGQLRLTFESDWLVTGLPELPVVIGLIAFREVFALSERLDETRLDFSRAKVEWLPRLKKGDLREMTFPTTLGIGTGTIVGAIPGAGGSIASFLNYQVVRAFARGKDKEEFGKGSMKGLAAVESANNSVIGGELIPTFGLGIPGAPAMIVIMTLLSAQGLQPGPGLLNTRPELLYATFGGLMVATFVCAVIGYFSIGPSIYMSKISPTATVVVTTLLVVVGVYSLRWSIFDVWVALVLGIFGHIMERHGYSVIALVLAFVLGGILESSLRRGLVMTFGWEGFFSRPLTIAILMVGAAIVIGPVIARWISRLGPPSEA